MCGNSLICQYAGVVCRCEIRIYFKKTLLSPLRLNPPDWSLSLSNGLTGHLIQTNSRQPLNYSCFVAAIKGRRASAMLWENGSLFSCMLI